MKKLLLFMSAIVLTATIAVAQEAKAGDMTKDRAAWEKKVKDELKLTADQQTKYDALNTEYDAKMDALKQDASLSPDAQKQKIMDLKKEKEGKLNEFLTPEQQEKYKTMMEQKKKDMKKPANY